MDYCVDAELVKRKPAFAKMTLNAGEKCDPVKQGNGATRWVHPTRSDFGEKCTRPDNLVSQYRFPQQRLRSTAASSWPFACHH